jgi:hypothetical protein
LDDLCHALDNYCGEDLSSTPSSSGLQQKQYARKISDKIIEYFFSESTEPIHPLISRTVSSADDKEESNVDNSLVKISCSSSKSGASVIKIRGGIESEVTSKIPNSYNEHQKV